MFRVILVCFFISANARDLTWSPSINNILRPFPMLPQPEQHTAEKSNVLHSIAAGAQLALRYCQREFQWDRWNCPDSVFSRKGRQIVTKEAAFVSAIMAAGIIHTVSRDCRRGELSDCDGDPLAYADKITAEFLQALERDSKDVSTTVNKHNYVVGQQAVRSSVRQDCRCEGLCRNKVCRVIEGSFTDIAFQLRRSYNTAKKVEWNSVTVNAEFKTDQKQLLFLADSPDYCQPNNTTGWQGTAGRSCSRARGPQVTRQERRSCRTLCRTCGLSVRRRARTLPTQCNCQFHWCCSVTCQQCDKVVQQHFCE